MILLAGFRHSLNSLPQESIHGPGEATRHRGSKNPHYTSRFPEREVVSKACRRRKSSPYTELPAKLQFGR